MLTEFCVIDMRAAVAIGMSAVVILGVAVVVLVNVKIVPMSTGVIGFEFALKYQMMLRSRLVCDEIMTGGPNSICTEMHDLAVVTTALEFALPAPSEKPFLPF